MIDSSGGWWGGVSRSYTLIAALICHGWSHRHGLRAPLPDRLALVSPGRWPAPGSPGPYYHTLTQAQACPEPYLRSVADGALL